MTRDEAIRILKYNSNVIHKTINRETDPNEIEALDMAIKALQLQQDCKDYVSRQTAIDALDKEYRCTDQSDDWGGLKTAMLIIENLPSAQPEHMHTVMLKIKEKYEKAMNTPCINNPIAWALYQTWKEYDR